MCFYGISIASLTNLKHILMLYFYWNAPVRLKSLCYNNLIVAQNPNKWKFTHTLHFYNQYFDFIQITRYKVKNIKMISVADANLGNEIEWTKVVTMDTYHLFEFDLSCCVFLILVNMWL